MKTRQTFILVLGVLAQLGSAPLIAEETETLFQPSTGLVQAQGGPGVKALFLDQGTALLVGGAGTLLLGEHLGLGAGGYSLSNELVIQMPGHKRDLGLSFGGLVLDYSFAAKRLFYLNVAAMSGMGQAFAVPRLTGADRVQANFYFIDTQFTLMLNATRDLRVGLGVGLFATGGVDMKNVIGAGLNGVNAQFILYYGKL